MKNGHLDDIELFEYTEGELDTQQRARAKAHLDTCAACSSQLVLAQAGGNALRSAPQFEHPPEALGRALSSLGAQEAEPAAAAGFPLRRWVAVLAPVAAVAGVVAIVILATGGDEDVSGGEAAAPPPAAVEEIAPAPAPAPAEESQRISSESADTAIAAQ